MLLIVSSLDILSFHENALRDRSTVAHGVARAFVAQEMTCEGNDGRRSVVVD